MVPVRKEKVRDEMAKLRDRWCGAGRGSPGKRPSAASRELRAQFSTEAIMAKNRASVPKFGTWDTDNVGYTVYFEKVRENKGATAPPLQRPYNPNDPEEDAPPRLITPAASNRAGLQQQHRRGGRQRPVAVPRFGVWDEQSAAAQGFTVQFERVKRDREVARGAPPGVPRRRMPSPETYANARRSQTRHTPFYSKMFGCFLPQTRD
ncbi:uncharacterized protein LOC124649583 [Lolium rigidum]|uniref:uncharacterized protein LOC124649583 n=1 Tax=Lolium rigidum TaxID=89674 RepID=UPI001F5DF3D8|nr:uncharacterized protein LOC124649583 [Lolium rigidum]